MNYSKSSYECVRIFCIIKGDEYNGIFSRRRYSECLSCLKLVHILFISGQMKMNLLSQYMCTSQKDVPQQMQLRYGLPAQERHCLLCNNKSHIPQKILKRMLRFIEANSSVIIEKWVEQFNEIRYFC